MIFVGRRSNSCEMLINTRTHVASRPRFGTVIPCFACEFATMAKVSNRSCLKKVGDSGTGDCAVSVNVPTGLGRVWKCGATLETAPKFSCSSRPPLLTKTDTVLGEDPYKKSAAGFPLPPSPYRGP